MIKFFDKRFEKKKVLDILKCNRDKDNYILYSSTLNDIIAQDLDSIDAVAYFSKGENNKYSNENELSAIYVVISLGSEIDRRIKYYFDTGQYLEGILLSTLGDEILLSLSDDLHNYLKSMLEPNTYLSRRFDVNEVTPEVSEIIFNIVNSENNIEDLTITSGYMLNNSKSMCYFYGVSKNICIEGSQCDSCLITDCEQKKYNIKIIGTNLNLTCYKYDNLLDVLNDNDIRINSYCNGNGTCKKCYVDIESNNTIISVLACDYYIINDINVTLPNTSDNLSILSDYKIFPYEKNKFSLLEIKNLSLNKYSSLEDLLGRPLSIKAMKKINKFENLDVPIQVLTMDNIIVDIGENISGFTIAIDIGTTTVVVALINVINGEILDTIKFINPQKKYGFDIISRINYATKDCEKLTNLIIQKIIESIDSLVDDTEKLHNIVISGNTTMIYLLCGVNPKFLGVSPYTFGFNRLLKINSTEIFNKNYGDVIIFPALSAYVGGDITAGILGTNLINSDKKIILVDIGTNGEIVLKSDKLYCCATAAGPVFEGNNIECGCPSVDGAICNVYMENNKFNFKTINDKLPIGICGSGVIDIMATLLDNDIVNEDGLMEEFEKIQITENFYFSQADIRALQLAKSSIKSGIDTLLKEANLSYEDIDTLYLGGGFGSNISLENTIKIGLLPTELASKIVVVGNCGLFGTIKMATQSNCHLDIEAILKQAEYIELSSNTFFSEKFIENLNFVKNIF